MQNLMRTIMHRWYIFAIALLSISSVAGLELGANAAGSGAQDAFPLLKGPYLGQPLIPNGNRITSTLPDFLDRLREAVELDNIIPQRWVDCLVRIES